MSDAVNEESSTFSVFDRSFIALYMDSLFLRIAVMDVLSCCHSVIMFLHKDVGLDSTNLARSPWSFSDARILRGPLILHTDPPVRRKGSKERHLMKTSWSVHAVFSSQCAERPSSPTVGWVICRASRGIPRLRCPDKPGLTWSRAMYSIWCVNSSNARYIPVLIISSVSLVRPPLTLGLG